MRKHGLRDVGQGGWLYGESDVSRYILNILSVDNEATYGWVSPHLMGDRFWDINFNTMVVAALGSASVDIKGNVRYRTAFVKVMGNINAFI